MIQILGRSVPFWPPRTPRALNGSPAVAFPLAAFVFVCPVVAAVILEYRRGGEASVTALLRQSFDFARIEAKGWYVPLLLLYPAILVASFVLLRLCGVEVPAPQFSAESVLTMSAALWSALGTGLVVGSVWAVWHWPALLQAHRSAPWIAWWSLATVATRVIMVWLNNNTGRSVFAMAPFHMITNLGWQLFPVHGSYFDQPSVAVIMAVVATLIVMVWKPGTLRTARQRGRARPGLGSGDRGG
ncbi:hypothetical protein [Nonomuraea sp. NPDC050643]|uniref:hypothetical protein n=1 Tax=Nonomuraea sp. NPDC050643 TaxID=3155660 RepID=UPI0033FBC8C7